MPDVAYRASVQHVANQTAADRVGRKQKAEQRIRRGVQGREQKAGERQWSGTWGGCRDNLWHASQQGHVPRDKLKAYLAYLHVQRQRQNYALTLEVLEEKKNNNQETWVPETSAQQHK